MNRRSFVVGAASFAAFGAAACARPRKIAKSFHNGVEFKELIHKETDDFLPLVIPIHGNGGAPEHWVNGWMPFPGRVSFALPRGFNKDGEGSSWFPTSNEPKNEKLATDVSAAEEKLWKGIVSLARGRKVMLAGYAEGAMICYAMALLHPDQITHAFAVASICPTKLVPKEKTRTAPITAYHGVNDKTFPVPLARDGATALKAVGVEMELREYANVDHSPSDKMHEDLWVDMQKAMMTGPAAKP